MYDGFIMTLEVEEIYKKTKSPRNNKHLSNQAENKFTQYKQIAGYEHHRYKIH